MGGSKKSTTVSCKEIVRGTYFNFTLLHTLLQDIILGKIQPSCLLCGEVTPSYYTSECDPKDSWPDFR